MHACYRFSDESTAVAAFGLNAEYQLGALLITSRSSSDTCQVAVLESVPSGTVEPDGSVSDPTNVDELAVLSTVLAADSGFVFDGFNLQQLCYVAVDVTGDCAIDVSFVPNRVPVDIGKPGGFV